MTNHVIKAAKRQACRAMIRRIRIMREMRTNTYQACKVLRLTYRSRHA